MNGREVTVARRLRRAGGKGKRNAERSGAVEEEVTVARRLRHATWGGDRGGGGHGKRSEALSKIMVMNFGSVTVEFLLRFMVTKWQRLHFIVIELKIMTRNEFRSCTGISFGMRNTNNSNVLPYSM